MRREKAIAILKTYKEQYATTYGITALGLFGSVARDEANAQSDVDVVVQTDKASLYTLVHIKNALEALFHSPVDIIRYRETMNPYLKNNIEQEAVYV